MRRVVPSSLSSPGVRCVCPPMRGSFLGSCVTWGIHRGYATTRAASLSSIARLRHMRLHGVHRGGTTRPRGGDVRDGLQPTVPEDADPGLLTNAEWLDWGGHRKAYQSAKQLGLFPDVFRSRFKPKMNLIVHYGDNHVFHGNIIPVSVTREKPRVIFQAQSKSLWTLLMTTPDFPVRAERQRDREFRHWLVMNIPSSGDVSAGDTIVEYLPPIPPRWIGNIPEVGKPFRFQDVRHHRKVNVVFGEEQLLHRFVFVLYRQQSPIDISVLDPHTRRVGANTIDGREDTSTNSLFHSYSILPKGLCFFQTKFDETVEETCASIPELGTAMAFIPPEIGN